MPSEVLLGCLKITASPVATLKLCQLSAAFGVVWLMMVLPTPVLMVALAYDTLRRRSELVSLRMGDIHRLGSGASIYLRSGKTDQEGMGAWLQVSSTTLRAIDDWLEAAHISDGLLFQGIKGSCTLTGKLYCGQIGRIFKRLARSAQLPASIVAKVSGHSLRVGAAQDLLVSGASLPQIMVKGGWTKVDTVIRYVEKFGAPVC